jgi:hypothetical protein
VNQNAVTLITPLQDAGKWEALAKLLRARGDELQRNPNAGAGGIFAPVPQLHFLSFFVIPPNGDSAAFLGMEANFDGPRRRFFDCLATENCALSDMLDEVYDFCANCPGKNATVAAWRDYFETADAGYQLFYVGCPGRSVQQIEEEQQLADSVEQCVQRLREPTGRRSEHVREIWRALKPMERQRVLCVPKRPFWVRHRLLERPFATLYGWLVWPLYGAGMAAIILVLAQGAGNPVWKAVAPPDSVVQATWCWAMVLLGIVAIVTVCWLLQFRSEFPAELTPRMKRYVVAVKVGEYIAASLRAVLGFAALLGVIALVHWHAKLLSVLGLASLGIAAIVIVVLAVVWAVRLVRIARREPDDQVNAMTWDAVKLTEVRRREDHPAQNHFVSVTAIRPGALRLLTLRAVLWWIHRLARVFHNPRGLFNTQSIHFARWTILRGRHLLFVSNYGGSFGGYLGLFATFGAVGVSAIWGNTVGFPRTFLLFWDGARDEQRFKCYARDSQIESLLWYRRYPELTVSAIERNAAIREELARFSRSCGVDGRGVSEAELDAFLHRFSVPRS